MTVVADRRLAGVLALLAATGFAACNAVSGVADVEFGATASGDTSGSGGATGAGGAGTGGHVGLDAGSGGSGGATTGTGGSGGCTAPTKLCNGQCVSPGIVNGCGPADCGPCKASGDNYLPVCVGGQCEKQCAPGFGDCDNHDNNGCETPTGSDATNCGACGVTCAQGTLCVGGACTAPCAPPTGECDGSPQVICETDLSTDAASCGACGHSCQLPFATSKCVGGACVVDVCAQGRGDCDGDPTNGCEVKTTSDPLHCGACARPCGATHVEAVTCSSGLCKSTCAPGWGNCNVPLAPSNDDGCEDDVASVASCGGCGLACAAGLACGAAGCGCTDALSCGPGGTCAAGVCTCNAKACGAGETCAANGACQCGAGPNCTNGKRCCGLSCVSQNDPKHCGGCGHACAFGLECVSGACQCTDDNQCDAGGGGACVAGNCVCGGGAACADGLRCLANGTCG